MGKPTYISEFDFKTISAAPQHIPSPVSRHRLPPTTAGPWWGVLSFHGVQWGDDGRQIEPLPSVPRPALFSRSQLKIAAGQIVADSVAVDGAVDWNGRATNAGCNDNLDLVLEVPGLWRVRHTDAIVDDCVGWLEKEERRLAIGIAPHFAGVSGVIAPHAENPTYRKACSRSVDSNGWNGGRRSYKTGIARPEQV